MVQEFSAGLSGLFYIDGNHDAEAVAEDFANCAKVLRPGGKIVLDDSTRLTNYRLSICNLKPPGSVPAPSDYTGEDF